jgi:hypothetical protein
MQPVVSITIIPAIAMLQRLARRIDGSAAAAGPKLNSQALRMQSPDKVPYEGDRDCARKSDMRRFFLYDGVPFASKAL